MTKAVRALMENNLRKRYRSRRKRVLRRDSEILESTPRPTSIPGVSGFSRRKVSLQKFSWDKPQ